MNGLAEGLSEGQVKSQNRGIGKTEGSGYVRVEELQRQFIVEDNAGAGSGQGKTDSWAEKNWA